MKRTLSHLNLVDVLLHRAKLHDDEILFRFLQTGEVDGPIETLSYAGLLRRAKAVGALLQGLGGAGERALLLYPPGLEFMVGLFGCMLGGAIAVPTFSPDPSQTERLLKRFAAIVADARPRFVLTTRAFAEMAPTLMPGSDASANLRWICTDELDDGLAQRWEPPRVDGDTLALLQYTSGSTSTPKGVMISHANLVHNQGVIAEVCGVDEGYHNVLWLPVFHDLGLLCGVIEPLCQGHPCTLMSPVAFLQKPVRWLQAITHFRARGTAAPSFAYGLVTRKVTDAELSRLDLSSLIMCGNGAEPVSGDALRGFIDRFAVAGLRPVCVAPIYGLAEATLAVTATDYRTHFVSLPVSGEAMKRGALVPVAPGHAQAKVCVSVGRPLEGTELLVVHPGTLRRAAPDAIGEIWVQSPDVAKGYWGNPDETARIFGARLADGDEGPYLRTGDLGFIHDGWLYITGRHKDLLIFRGVNHYPQDIEATVEQSSPLVRTSCVAAFAIMVNEEERLVISAEVKAPSGLDPDFAGLAGRIRAAIAEEHGLPVYAVSLLEPRTIPKTSSGKIQRHLACQEFTKKLGVELHRWQEGNVSGPGITAASVATARAPLTRTPEEIEAWLVQHLSGRLALSPDRLDVNEPFVAFGADSLKAAEMAGELSRWLGVEVPATSAWSFPSIRALARHLAGQPREPVDERSDAPAVEPIAIIGMHCRFPGASSPEDFWSLLRDGRSAIRPVPEDRWMTDDVPLLGGFVDDLDKFDADFFGISHREAAGIDPQQRLLLEETWKALESAAIPPDSLAGSNTGVFFGLSTVDYSLLTVADPADINAWTGTGTVHCIAANRVSYVLDLRGPSMAVDAACASSLVAVHQACLSLQSGESSLALAGGVNCILSPHASRNFQQAQMLSADGRCKTFDAGADGYVRGEGCGVVVLKRLADARADGDCILAVIHGSAVTQSGRSNGITAPSQVMQAAAIGNALARAGLSARDVSYVEAHGTGTALGDPVEFAGLVEALGDRPGHLACKVGSVKTNLGHLEAASGMAGLIKVILTLQHGQIPAHLNFHTLNPRIDLKGVPFVIPTELGGWPAGYARRLAGVSSYGFGGANAHVIVGEAPADLRAEAAPAEAPAGPYVLPLSARSEGALKRLTEKMVARLRAPEAITPADLCASAGTGRTHHPWRLAAVGRSSAELADALSATTTEHVNLARGGAPTRGAARLAMLFSGQGTQYPGMGRALYETQPVFRRTIDRCDALVERRLGRPLVELLCSAEGGEPTQDLLDRTEITQPVLYCLQVALFALWSSWGVKPSMVGGHSVGAFAAAHAAGVFSLEDGLRLVMARGALMGALPRGAMAAVRADRARVVDLLDRLGSTLDLAAVNAPEEVVISGPTAEVGRVVAAMAENGLKATPLRVSHAFHSAMMEPMLDAFAELWDSVSRFPPKIPFVSDLTGKVLDAPRLGAASYWREHARRPVRFADLIQTMADAGASAFLELGPGAHLLALGRSTAPRSQAPWIPSLRKGRDEQQIFRALASLYVSGQEIDWKARGGAGQRGAALPTYPFERQRHWASRLSPLMIPRATAGASDQAFEIGTGRHPLLRDHQVYGQVVVPAVYHVINLLGEARRASGDAPVAARDFSFHRPLLLSGDAPRKLQLSAKGAGGGGPMEIWERSDGERVTYVTCSVEPRWGAPPSLAGVFTPPERARQWLKTMTAQAFFSKARESGLQLGPAFQWLEQTWQNGDEVLASLRAPGPDDDRGDLAIHLGQLDTLMQLMAPLVTHRTGGHAIFLPYMVEHIRLFAPPRGRLWAQARLRVGGDPGALVGDMRLLGDEGEVVAEVEGLSVRAAPRAALMRALHADLDQWFYEVSWSRAPQPAAIAPARAGRWLILSNGRGLGDACAARLRERGESCTSVQLGGVREATLRDPERTAGSPGSFDEVLAAGSAPCSDVIYVMEDEGPDADVIAGSVCRDILSLTQALVRTSAFAVPRLWLVTRHVHRVSPDDAPSSPAGSALWSLGQVIGHEHPELRCTMVDLGAAATSTQAEWLLEEVNIEGENRVAYRDGVRFVARLAQAAVPASTSERTVVTADGTYLITGGYGALGLHCADWLVSQGARELVLLGRSPASTAAQSRVEDLRSRGARVHVRQADLTDPRRMEEVFASVGAGSAPLRGVIHAAGVLDDGTLLQQDWSRMAAVMAPKVTGTWNLVALTDPRQLDFFVMFSSAVSVLGAPGQASYAAANGFMDGVAHQLRARGKVATVINWGPWSGAGMVESVSARHKSSWGKLGLSSISPEAGVEALRRVLGRSPTQLMILPAKPSALVGAFPAGSLPVLLSELSRSGAREKTSDASKKNGQLLQALSTGSPSERRARLAAFVGAKLAEVLGRAGEDLPMDEDLINLGLDSLMGLELRTALAASLGREVPASLVIEAGSVGAVTDRLLELYSFDNPAESMDPAPAQVIAEAPNDEPVRPALARFAPKFDAILQDLNQAREAGHYHFGQPVKAIHGQHVEGLDGSRKLMFATYNYLGLLGHPHINQAAMDAVARYGTGTHGARLIAGTLDIHLALEAKLAEFHGREAAMLFTSGFMANYAIVPALVGPGDWVISDQLNHASLVDGCLASRADFRVFRHNDMNHLEEILRGMPRATRALVVADGIFSLDGDIFNLPEAVALCRRYGALLMVDEAHSLGVLGDTGRGIEEHFGMPGSVDVIMGTLSKAIPASGGYVAGSNRVIDFLRHAARGYIFSGATPPSAAAAALAAFEVLDEEMVERRRKLENNARLFVSGLRAAGYNTGLSCTPIIPVIVGSLTNAIIITSHCQQNGLYAVPAIPPAVPHGTSRLRLNVTSALSTEEILQALKVITEGGRYLVGAGPIASHNLESETN